VVGGSWSLVFCDSNSLELSNNMHFRNLRKNSWNVFDSSRVENLTRRKFVRFDLHVK
jgi:hypothetical protein